MAFIGDDRNDRDKSTLYYNTSTSYFRIIDMKLMLRLEFNINSYSPNYLNVKRVQNMNTQAGALLAYVNRFGMIGCNSNKYVTSISEMGISLNAVMELIDHKEIFYTKVFMRRTVYISKQLYFLLKAIKGCKAHNYYESHILEIMKMLQPVSTKYLKAACKICNGKYNENFNKLLENMSITAYCTYEFMNPHWASMLYVTSSKWEEEIKYPSIECPREEAEEKIKSILSNTIGQKYIEKLINDLKAE